MDKGYHDGHHPVWCPACAATEKMIDEMSPGDLARAIGKLGREVQANPDSAPTLLARGMVHSKKGDDRRATSTLPWKSSGNTPAPPVAGPSCS